MRKITLSADEELIVRARERAKREKRSLNEAFQKWLEQYAGHPGPIMTPAQYEEFMRQFAHIRPGGPYTRDEMNER
ncbi:MAG: hypothetical protein LAQ69_23645 [Acidobacteriia bacterium]|nr:hypothetical protein [Terriglobia bacterium]